MIGIRKALGRIFCKHFRSKPMASKFIKTRCVKTGVTFSTSDEPDTLWHADLHRVQFEYGPSCWCITGFGGSEERHNRIPDLYLHQWNLDGTEDSFEILAIAATFFRHLRTWYPEELFVLHDNEHIIIDWPRKAEK